MARERRARSSRRGRWRSSRRASPIRSTTTWAPPRSWPASAGASPKRSSGSGSRRGRKAPPFTRAEPGLHPGRHDPRGRDPRLEPRAHRRPGVDVRPRARDERGAPDPRHGGGGEVARRPRAPAGGRDPGGRRPALRRRSAHGARARPSARRKRATAELALIRWREGKTTTAVVELPMLGALRRDRALRLPEVEAHLRAGLRGAGAHDEGRPGRRQPDPPLAQRPGPARERQAQVPAAGAAAGRVGVAVLGSRAALLPLLVLRAGQHAAGRVRPGHRRSPLPAGPEARHHGDRPRPERGRLLGAPLRAGQRPTRRLRHDERPGPAAHASPSSWRARRASTIRRSTRRSRRARG